MKVPNVSVQVRGQSSTKAVIKNYKIRIKDGMGKFRGQRTLNLNKHQIDPYRFTNKMCYDMANSVPELIGGRTQFVQLFVKDETEGKGDKYVDYGLYTMVEQVNRTYLKSRNLDENGQLYKVSFFEWNKYDEIMVSYDSPDFDQKAFEEKLEIKGDKDNSKLNEIVEKLNNKMTPIDEIVDEHFNAENICYWMAFNILIGNYDSGPRNLFLYSPLNSEKFYFICWDMDASFRKEYLIVKDHSDGLSWLRGMSQYLGLVLANRMFKEEKYRDMLTDAIEDIHTNYVNQNIVNEYASEYSKLTKPFLYGGADSDNAKLHAEDFDRLVACLGDEVEENYEYYYEMMNAPWPFFVGFPERDGDKMILNWDASYDVNGESVSYDYKLARDYYFNDIISEGEDLIAPSVVIDELDPGVYFLRVVATNESGYSQDCFDYCSISGIGKVYACLAFEIKQDGSIIEYTEPKSN